MLRSHPRLCRRPKLLCGLCILRNPKRLLFLPSRFPCLIGLFQILLLVLQHLPILRRLLPRRLLQPRVLQIQEPTLRTRHAFPHGLNLSLRMLGNKRRRHQANHYQPNHHHMCPDPNKHKHLHSALEPKQGIRYSRPCRRHRLAVLDVQQRPIRVLGRKHFQALHGSQPFQLPRLPALKQRKGRCSTGLQGCV